ncbi:leucine-rich repeat-containing protein 37A-like [Eschrichtius robustus]
MESSPVQQEFPDLPLEPLKETEPSPAQQEDPSQPPAPPKEVVAQTPVHYEMTVPTLGQDQAQHSNLPSVTVKPLDQGLPTAPEPTTEAEHSAALQQTAVPPTYPDVTFPNPEQVQAQHPTLTEVTVQPLDLELTLTLESSMEVEPSPTMQQTQAQPPELIKEVVAQSPLYPEVTVPAPDHDHAEHPTSPSITVKPLDLELTTTPEPTTESEHSTALQQTTAPPPKHPEVTLAQPNLTQVTIQPMDVELTVTGGSNMETVPSPIMQETPTQPSEAPQEVAVQSPFQQEVTVPTPCQDYVQYSTSSSVTVHHVDLEQTTTAEPTMEAGHSTALQQTTAPPPKHPEVTLAQPNLTQVTVPPVDLGVNIFHEPRPSETVLFPSTQYSVPTGLPGVKYTPEKQQPEQNATTNISICELCTCKNETLSCAGLSPKQKLHRVPEPEPNAYSGTFTIINFQGNSISYIDESIWQAYRWAEKLG